ncbi:MAG TPA: hypothetical protein VGE74_21710, partial [Gemmata sp.]
MIPTLIQRRGAQHLAEEEAHVLSPADDAPALDPPPAVLALVPESIARENCVLPLYLESRTLHVATVDTSNILLRDKLSFLLNKNIQFVEYPLADILEAINAKYGQPETQSVDSMLVEFTDTAIEATRTDYDESESRAPVPKRRMRRSLSRAVTEFKKGLKGIEDEVGRGKPFRITPPGAPKFDEGSISGEDTTPDYGTESMWHYTVEEGQRALMIHKDGRMEVIVGPKRVWSWGKRFERMKHFVAHPGDFLVVRFRDGRQEHIAGPTDVWFEPRVHEGITRQEALQLAA